MSNYVLDVSALTCLALGRTKKLPVVTADKIWSELDLGVKVILIR